jgi:WD40 repeat protein/tRNA A-37 threonylcarbamoyl transferase component Bud32
MNPDRSAQVYRLFEAALRCDPADRATLLDAGCGGDAELRGEVERLLAEDERASRDRFLAAPAPAAAGAGADTIRAGLWGLTDGNAHVRCPHCQNPIELTAVPTSGEVICAACGSTFRLEAGSTATWGRTARGRRLGRFELLQAVGAGAFGTVYKARDPKLDRTVAVKVPRAGNLPDGQELDRFLREARSTAQLRHPAIVPVYEVGQENGVPYLVSDFVDGVTLGDRLTAGGLPGRAAAALMAEVAEALDHAHRRGVIHRDMKPSNIMLRGDGSPAVMDFGLAKRSAGEVTMTLDGQLLGTPAYMSPEQAGGGGHTVDGRSDVYSLGVILYHLLAGELPFRGNVRMLLHQVLHDEPRSPRSLNDRVPRDLETICLKAMAKEPARRYATAGELAADLRRWLAGELIAARPVGRFERGWRWTGRHPAEAGVWAASLVAVLALVAAGFFLAYSKAAESQRSLAVKARQVADEQRALAIKAQGQEAAARKTAEEKSAVAVKAQAREAIARKLAEEQRALAVKAQGLEAAARQTADEQRRLAQDALELANRYLYFLRVKQAEASWAENLPARTAELLRACPPEQRGWEWYYLDQQRHAPLLELNGHTNEVRSLSYSPDGRLLASASEDGTLRVWDTMVGGRQFTLRGHTVGVRNVAYCPDGRRIASADSGGTVRVWDTQTGRQLLAFGGSTGAVFALRYSPDGRRIACAGVGKATVCDALTGQVLFQFGVTDGRMSYSPDGRHIACGEGGVVKLRDATTGKELQNFGRIGYVVGTLSYSPDGRRVVAADDRTVKVWDAATGQEVLTLRGHAGWVTGVSYSPDGRRIASASIDRTVKVWDATTGQELFCLRGHNGGVHDVAFSPDGRRIASAGGDATVKVWDALTDQEVFAPGGPQKFALTSISFSADGRLIAAGSGAGVAVWGAKTRQPRHVLRGATSYPSFMTPSAWDILRVEPGRVSLGGPSLSPDGRYIAVNADHTVKVWETTDGRELFTLRGHARTVSGVAYSPDGLRIASSNWDQTVKVWDATTGRELLTCRGHTSLVQGVAYSPDGLRIASAGMDATVRVWDAATGQEVLRLESHTGPVNGVAVSPDGRCIASASDDRTVKVWDATNGRALLTLRGHAGSVTGVAYSPDGRRIASVSGNGTSRAIWAAGFFSGSGRGASALGDGTIRVWDAATGQEALTLRGQAGLGLNVAYSPDGHCIATISEEDETVKLWDATPVTPQLQRERLALVDQRWPVWAKQEAEECERKQQWFAAAWHLGRLIAASPRDGLLHARRGPALANLGRWAEAVESQGQAIAYGAATRGYPSIYYHRGFALAWLGRWAEADADFVTDAGRRNQSGSWFDHALLRLHLGDLDGYRDTCKQILERPDKTATSSTWKMVAVTCTQAPEAVADLERLVRLAETTVRREPKDWWSREVLGRTLYRAGHSAEAVKRLREAVSLQNATGNAWHWLFLAMAYHDLGSKAEARRELDKARSWLDKELARPPGGSGEPGSSQLSWNQRLELMLLRREAEVLIKEGRPLYLPANVFQEKPGRDRPPSPQDR